MILFTISAAVSLAAVIVVTSNSQRHLPRRSRKNFDDVVWLSAFIAFALLLSIPQPRLVVVFLPGALVASVFARAHHQRKAEARRASAIASELPVVVELMALAVSAGESPASALARVAQVSQGALGAHLKESIAAIQEGASLIRGLELLKNQARHFQVDRFVDSLILGYERGTSLIEVLHSQALDSREQFRRSLIEHSAKAEIRMMVPIVFLIMPVTILFALFPSLYSLTQAQ